VDGREVGEFGLVDSVKPFWTPSGDRLVFECADLKRSFRAGEWRSEEYDAIDRVTFSADGTRLAFGAVKGREVWWKVVAPPKR
jgi:hypothetical protein